MCQQKDNYLQIKIKNVFILIQLLLKVINKDLVNYIKESLKRNSSIEEIKKSLLNHGWAEKEINEGIDLSSKDNPNIITTDPEFDKDNGSSTASKNKLIFIIAGVILLIIILGVISFFLFIDKSENDSIEGNNVTPSANTGDDVVIPTTSNVCVSNNDCKISCINCKTGKQICNINSGICLECTSDAQCAIGFRCSNQKCISRSSGGSSGSGSGSGGSSSGSTTSGTVAQNCDSNLNCFLELAKSCADGRLTHQYNSIFLGVERDAGLQYSLNGKNGEKCIFSLEFKSANAKFTEEHKQYLKSEYNMSDEQIAANEQEENTQYRLSIGKRGTCNLNATDISTTLNYWKDSPINIGAIPEDIYANAGCTGTYFS